MTNISIHNKHFGKVSAILFLLAFILLANIGYAPQYFNKVFKLSNTIVVVITILFLPICYFTYKKRLIWGYRSILWGILFSFSSMLFMHFEDSLLEKYERGEISLLDKNASISIGEPILLGIVFIFFLIYGAIYDIIIAKKNK